MFLIRVIIFRGSCSDFPPNKRSKGGHRLFVLPNEINENGAWIDKEKKKKEGDYAKRANLRGQYISIEKYDKMGRDIGGDYYRFIARSEYINPDHKAGCNPLLRVQFFATKKNEEQNIGYDNECKYLNNLNFVLYKHKFCYDRLHAIECNGFHYI